MSEQGRGEIVLLTAAVLAAGAAARKIVDVIWVSATGRHTPRVDDPQEAFGSAAAAAMLSGALVALVHMSVTRKAHEISRRRRASA
jgi:hypothetical protein